MALQLPATLSYLSKELVLELETFASTKELDGGTEVLREGQYVKVIPVVLDGLIKVFTRSEDRDLLLYYIQPGESCVMSFAAGMKNEPSKIFAVTEETTRILLLPTEKVGAWGRLYPEINNLFFQQYNLRYTELLDTINQVLFQRLDQRLYDFLKERVAVTGRNPLPLSHQQIANELGTAREVISRVMKKLEAEGKVQQKANNQILIF
ncbi:MAG: Crp/Fnr family transcriptional regulator [Cyclobacteriaceae bacterium]